MAKAQAQEPSMEDILASIRRIIADEEKPPAPPPPPDEEPDEPISEDELDQLFANVASDPEPEAVEESDEEDVLDLTEENIESFLVEGVPFEQEDLQFTETKPEPEPPPPPPPHRAATPPPPLPERPSFEERLVSEATDRAVASAFDNLSMMVVNRNARTIEDLVEDMLRPMLKAWLDQNLPPMVERLVRAEIERVARGGR